MVTAQNQVELLHVSELVIQFQIKTSIPIQKLKMSEVWKRSQEEYLYLGQVSHSTGLDFHWMIHPLIHPIVWEAGILLVKHFLLCLRLRIFREMRK